MASDSSSKVPITLRDFFFTDPFFKTSWDDFDRVREEMLKESRDFWSSVERDMKQMESAFSSMMSSSSSRSIQQSSSSSSSQQQTSSSALENKTSSSNNNTSLVPASSSDNYSPWFFPRKWMLPKLFGAEDEGDNRMRSLDLFQHKDDQVIRVKDDESKFEVSLDLHQFRPDEIKVSVRDGFLSVEAKHEEKSENRFESRQFSRGYTLPGHCESERVHSNLSSDGILVITAPKKPALKSVTVGSTAIPVEHK